MYKTAGCCRLVYNSFLASAKENKDFNYNEYSKHLTNLKKEDFLNKLVDYLIKNHDCVILEDLSIHKMIKKLGERKKSFNRLMTMIPMYEFRQKLQYKAMLAGKHCVAVNPANTSRTCSACGNVDKKSRKSQSDFECTRCGMSANADYNAAINIHNAGVKHLLAAGHAVKSAHATALAVSEANLSAVLPSSFGFSA